jgi:hypothetical protein
MYSYTRQIHEAGVFRRKIMIGDIGPDNLCMPSWTRNRSVKTEQKPEI